MRMATALLLLVLPAAVSAQDRGAAVAGSVSAVNMASHTDAAFAGAFAYRFSRVVEFEIETTWVPRVRSPFPDNPVVIQNTSFTTATPPAGSTVVQIFPTPYYSSPGGRIAIFTNTARINMPTTAARLTPYFAAGGGIASVRRTADFNYSILGVLPPPNQPLRPITQPIVSSSTNLALTLGGGVDIKMADAFSIDADLRLFRLLGDTDRNLGRFGVGVRYRF